MFSLSFRYCSSFFFVESCAVQQQLITRGGSKAMIWLHWQPISAHAAGRVAHAVLCAQPSVAYFWADSPQLCLMVSCP